MASVGRGITSLFAAMRTSDHVISHVHPTPSSSTSPPMPVETSPSDSTSQQSAEDLPPSNLSAPKKAMRIPPIIIDTSGRPQNLRVRPSKTMAVNPGSTSRTKVSSASDINTMVLGEDVLRRIVRFLPADNIFAFSYTCRLFNDARKKEKLKLWTTLAWTLCSPSVASWAESLGRPSPYPHWAELHGLQSTEHNGRIVKVLGKPNSQGRQVVWLHASLSSPEMQRSTPAQRISSVKRTNTPGENPMLKKRILVRPMNIRALHPDEIARIHVQFYSEEVLVTNQERKVTGSVCQFVFEHDCRLRRTGVVGGDIRGLTVPSMFGVEQLFHPDTPFFQDDYGRMGINLRGGSPFEILELLPHRFQDLPSVEDTLNGRARMFHARIRWIPSLPPRNPMSLPEDVTTRTFV